MNKIFYKLKRTLLTRCGKLLRVSSRIVSKKNLIIIGARNGDYYMDNSRALFEWYIANRPDQRIIWMTRNSSIYATLQRAGLPVARIDSIRGLFLLHRSSVGVFTNRSLDLAVDSAVIPDNLRLVFLGHGQPVKSSRLTTREGLTSRFVDDVRWASKRVSMATTTSPMMADIQSKCQGIPRALIKTTGLPSNDWIVDPPAPVEQEWHAFANNVTVSKVVLYAPTWRRSEDPTRLFPFQDLDIEALARFLADNRILMLIRPHIRDILDNEFNRELVESLMEHTPFVRLATNDVFADANRLLPFVDALISDYSSIYHDYLLLDRPIYLIPYDFDSFDKTNGFEYPYWENLPGPALSTQADLERELSQLIEGRDKYKAARAALREKIHTYQDAGACSRVAGAIDELLESTDNPT